jgi:hypothetical protein
MVRWYNENKATFWIAVILLAVVAYWISQNIDPVPSGCEKVTLGLLTSAPNASGSAASYGWTCDNGASIVVKYQDGSTLTVVVPSPSN